MMKHHHYPNKVYPILSDANTQTPFISKIAYIRWGQAWMLKGLSNLLRIQKDYKEIEN